VPFDEVKRLHKGLPPHVLFVIDAAYAEYVQQQRLRVRHRARRDQRERRDDAHVSRRSTASRRCGSAGCTARRM
jgi:histidinol-phosphate/aromatic aminotransferase/cobyric acid decarboxylase-like protein